MARFVIVPDFHNDKAWKQRKEERLEIPALIFSSNLDLAGQDIDSYLDELAEGFAPHVAEIWGRCIGGPQDPEDLKAYLKHNQIDCGFFYAAYGQATVPKVKASLAQRDKLMAFATRTQGMEPAELQKAFIKEFAELMARRRSTCATSRATSCARTATTTTTRRTRSCTSTASPSRRARGSRACSTTSRRPSRGRRASR